MTEKKPLCALNRSSGFAGALCQLFRRFPEVKEDIEKQYRGETQKGAITEAKKSIANIHKDFLAKLAALGVGEHEWPFNTDNEGYRSLCRHFETLLKDEPEKVIRERSGKNAARHLVIGRGYEPLLPARIPLSIMELDYAVQDAPSIIKIEDQYRISHAYPIARWYLGLLVDEFEPAIYGAHISLEHTPSADCALQTVLSAFIPEDHSDVPLLAELIPGNSILLPGLLPAFYRQGFGLLRVDNGWCNVASDFVNNVIDVIGCAMEFGAPRAWWLRPFVERLNGKLAERGLHRLRCTYGTGPDDPRRQDPDEIAAQNEIEWTDLYAIISASIHEQNAVFTPEKFHRHTVLEVLNQYASRPELGWMPQPLPQSSDLEFRLLMHSVEVCVRGDMNKGRRPYVQFARCRFTNERISSDFSLIGRTVRLQIDRMDPRRAWAVSLDTHEDLGRLIPEARWCSHRMPLQHWQIFNRISGSRPAERADSVVTQIMEIKRGARHSKGDRSSQISRVEALRLAKFRRDVVADEQETSATAVVPSTPSRNPLGHFPTHEETDDE
nr:hypothetical protein [Cupriavidus nantongensis]